MRKFAILFLFLTFNAQAVTQTQINSLPNKAYFQSFIPDYLKWHEKTFTSKFYSSLPEKYLSFLEIAVSELDHWKAPLLPEMDQILVGQTFEDGKSFYTYRLFLQEKVRSYPLLKDLKLVKSPMFMEWDDKGKLCFLTRTTSSEITWRAVPRVKDENYFEHHCLEKDGLKLSYISMTSKQKATWKDPFPSAYPEIRTYTFNGPHSIFYSNKDTHMGIIPSRHYFYINSHGIKGLLPFDKYSVNKTGDLTIYYP